MTLMKMKWYNIPAVFTQILICAILYSYSTTAIPQHQNKPIKPVQKWGHALIENHLRWGTTWRKVWQGLNSMLHITNIERWNEQVWTRLDGFKPHFLMFARQVMISAVRHKLRQWITYTHIGFFRKRQTHLYTTTSCRLQVKPAPTDSDLRPNSHMQP